MYKRFDEVLFPVFLASLQPYCALEPATKGASRRDPTEAASVSGQDVPDGGVVEHLDRWKPGGLGAKRSPVTLRGTSGRRADKMRSDMPSPILPVTPPH